MYLVVDLDFRSEAVGHPTKAKLEALGWHWPWSQRHPSHKRQCLSLPLLLVRWMWSFVIHISKGSWHSYSLLEWIEWEAWSSCWVGCQIGQSWARCVGPAHSCPHSSCSWVPTNLAPSTIVWLVPRPRGKHKDRRNMRNRRLLMRRIFVKIRTFIDIIHLLCMNLNLINYNSFDNFIIINLIFISI